MSALRGTFVTQIFNSTFQGHFSQSAFVHYVVSQKLSIYITYIIYILYNTNTHQIHRKKNLAHICDNYIIII